MQNHEHKSQELPQATHLQQYCINKKFSVLSRVSRMPTHADTHGAIYHCGLKTGQNHHHTDLVRLAWLLSARSSVTMSQNWPIMGHFAARIDLWCYTSLWQVLWVITNHRCGSVEEFKSTTPSLVFLPGARARV